MSSAMETLWATDRRKPVGFAPMQSRAQHPRSVCVQSMSCTNAFCQRGSLLASCVFLCGRALAMRARTLHRLAHLMRLRHRAT